MKQKEAIPAGSEWNEKDAGEFPGSPFQRIGAEWMLVTAGNIKEDKGNWNTMTASWGGLGVLWNKKVAFVFVRHSRQTFGFMNSAPVFTLSFFDGAQKSALRICGEKSGRDTDKASAAKITPVSFGNQPVDGAVSFREAKDILVCKNLYTHSIDKSLFMPNDIPAKIYHDNDYHRMYISEIIKYFRNY